MSDCRKGIALLGDSIHLEKWGGRDFYLTDDCKTRGFRKDKYLLISPYDEYLISYKSHSHYSLCYHTLDNITIIIR